MDSRFVRSRVKLAGLYRLMGQIEESLESGSTSHERPEMAETYRRLWTAPGLLVSERDRLLRQVETRYIGATGPAAMYAALGDYEDTNALTDFGPGPAGTVTRVARLAAVKP